MERQIEFGLIWICRITDTNGIIQMREEWLSPNSVGIETLNYI